MRDEISAMWVMAVDPIERLVGPRVVATVVVALLVNGIVAFAGVESGYGNYTCINHGNGIATCYGHQSVLMVKVGDQVKQGQVIGLVGSTGYSTGPHLHFEVRINGKVTDPLPWLIGVQKP